MREIKFRAWDGKRMLEWRPLDGLQDFGSLWNLLDGALWKYFVMQFTGLQDKNGKDIYEGDILGGYPHGECFVQWDDKHGCYTAIDTDESRNDFGLFSTQLQDCIDTWEIIGNIYENPELLKDRGIE